MLRQLCPDCKTDCKRSEEVPFEVSVTDCSGSEFKCWGTDSVILSTVSFSSAASSLTASSAGEASEVRKRHKKRGSGQTKKQGVPQRSTGNCQEGSGCAFLHRSRPRETKSEDERDPTRRPRQTSAAGTAEFAVFGLAMVAQIGTVDSAEPLLPPEAEVC